MSRHASRGAAWGIIGLSAALLVIAAALLALNWSTNIQTQETSDAYQTAQVAGWGLLFLTFAGVGALIVDRQPGNAIGWLVAWFGISSLLVTIADGYVLYALITNSGSLPGAAETAWFAILLTDTMLFPELALLFLLIPNGRLVSARWRALVGGIALVLPLLVITQLRPGSLTYYPLQDDIQITNPFDAALGDPFFDIVEALSGILVVLVLLAALTALLTRFRRSRGTERQQLKWFVLSGVVVLVVWGVTPFLAVLLDIPESTLNVLVLPGFFSIPIAIGIAILRHKLYDIDVIIRRTLIYGLLTLTLSLTYLALIVSLGALARSVTGEQSAVMTAASTMAVAALFRPMRSRIQSTVDRRFYRQTYDAARTLEAFSARLRDEVDLDALAEDLRGVVQETMQPEHVSLWLRPSQ